MILVIEKEKLNFSDAQQAALLSLTAKDQIYLVTKKGDTIPVEIIPVISKIAAKLEIKQLSDENSMFEKGFLYGSLSRSAGKEKVVILSEEKAPANLDENCAWNEGFAVEKSKRKKTSSAKKSETPRNDLDGQMNLPLMEENKAPVKATTPPPEEATKRQRSKKTQEPSVTDFFSHPSIVAIMPLVGGKKEDLKYCVADSSDAVIGYKYKLQLSFGQDGLKIWEKTYEKYDALKKLAKLTS